MEKIYLSEAFKQLEILNEEDFALDDNNGIEDIKSFLDKDEKVDMIDIIDPEATTEEELKDSYVGKVILDCCVCHSKIYKDAAEVNIDDETDLANVGEECPFCYTNDGFKIIGEVAPFVGKDNFKVSIEDKEEAEPAEEDPIEDEKNESLDEAKKEVCPECGKVIDKDHPMCDKCKKALADKDEKIDEALEKVELETEDQKIKIEAEPKEVIPDAEMINPVSTETQAEIETPAEGEFEEPVDVEGSEEMDYDVDDFDEDSFNELGESYLKEVYDNVNNFKTSNVSEKENKLVVEGVITFSSGKQKKTSFVFEAKDATRTGKVRFNGLNEQISRGKKSFTLTGSIANKRFIAESLNYNYRAKDSSGNSSRVYGTVKTTR